LIQTKNTTLNRCATLTKLSNRSLIALLLRVKTSIAIATLHREPARCISHTEAWKLFHRTEP